MQDEIDHSERAGEALPAGGAEKNASAREDRSGEGPKIWVGCLAAYNAGKLHGEWIDARDADEIRDAVREILAASPEPGAEEWAIFDHEGFEGAEVSEWAALDHVAALAAFIDEHGALGGKMLEHYGGDLEAAAGGV